VTTDERIASFLAERLGLVPEFISDVRMEASESLSWSEITHESFGCFVKFTYDGEERNDYWDEDDAVKFLNTVWASNRENTS
jgi:hypothetical protein